jgi:hypothetical protein
VLFNLFSKKEPAAVEEPKVHVPTIGGSTSIAKEVTHVSALQRRKVHHTDPQRFAKKGMWVRTSNSTGVLKDIEPGDVATVMLVDEQLGENVLEVHVPASSLRQAYYEEIPEARRPSHEHAIKFGYIRK